MGMPLKLNKVLSDWDQAQKGVGKHSIARIDGPMDPGQLLRVAQAGGLEGLAQAEFEKNKKLERPALLAPDLTDTTIAQARKSAALSMRLGARTRQSSFGAGILDASFGSPSLLGVTPSPTSLGRLAWRRR